MKHKHFVVAAVLLSGVALAAASWSIVPSASRGSVSSLLNGVTVVANDDVWAVGHWYDSQLASYRTLAEHWDGTQWKIASTPNVDSGYNDLNAVDATSQTDAWAVGYTREGQYSPSRTLILHWDGASWTAVSSPNPGASTNVLYGVTAVSPGDAWAVGWYYDSQFVGRPLILHWNGSQWSAVGVPSASNYVNVLLAVSASGPADAWAAGYTYLNGRYSTFFEHWNGSTWTIAGSPNIGTRANRIRAVSALSPSDAWAVGDSQDAGSLIEHWDGLVWSVVAHPTVSGATNTLWSVAALQANDVWTAGYARDGNGLRPLLQHWDGATWGSQVAPPVSGSNPWLTAVSGRPFGDAWAVGGVGAGTLTMRWTP